MNCQPGDLAIVVKEFETCGRVGDEIVAVKSLDATGRIVRCVRLSSRDFSNYESSLVWELESPLGPIQLNVAHVSVGVIPIQAIGLPDEILRPLRGDPVDEQLREEAVA